MYIFLFREVEVCFVIVDMYKVRMYLIDVYIFFFIFLFCVIYEIYWIVVEGLIIFLVEMYVII